jgi:hypothetical protein
MVPLQSPCHLSLGGLRHRAFKSIEARREPSMAVEMLTRWR